MNKKLLLVFLLLISLSIHAQNITILNSQNKEPIAGVAVFNIDKTQSEISNLEGEVSLNTFKNEDVVFFKHLSFQEFSATKSRLVKAVVVYLDPSTEGLDEVLISASKFGQVKRDIPQKVVSLSLEEIMFDNPQTSADLLENTGNVYIQKSQLGGGSPMIRGLSTNRLLITVDGVRMNNAIFRDGNVQNVISIDPFSIQHTEVIIGAGSVVYGSDAIGGVMSFYTKKPELSYSKDASFAANSVLRYATANNEKTGHLDFNIGLKKWAFLSSVSYTDFDDLRMGSHGPDDYLRTEYVVTENGVDNIVENKNPKIQNPTGYDQINLMQKIRLAPKDNVTYDLGLYYSTTSEYSRYDRLIRYKDDHLRSAEWNYGPQRWFMSNFQFTKLSSRSAFYDKIQANVAYQNFQESRIDRDYQSTTRNSTEEHVDAISANLDFEKQLSLKTEFFYGLEYVYNKVHSYGREEDIESNIIIPAISRYPNGSDWSSMSAYTNLKYKPSSQFVLQTGLRYNHVIANASFEENNVFLNLPFDTADINTGALTGTAGVSWIPADIIQWKLNFSTAFRAPNIDDIGKVFDSEPGAVVVPNDDLNPEYAYTGDLSVRLNFEDKIIIDAATYYTFLDDALVRRDFELNGASYIEYNGEDSRVQAMQNAAEARIYGFEAGIQISFTEALKLTSQYNVIGGYELEEGEQSPLRHAAPNFGNTHLSWQHNKITIDAFAMYNAEMSYLDLAPSEQSKDYIYASDADGNPYSPSWCTLNLRTQYKFNSELLVTASLENITDQRYRPYSSGISAPGRNLILALKYTL
ncbi:TonB-dependent receptor plug domain-containing protein [Formosa algae]|uniref:Hemoglobin/transferrin/lactoferrin receptor protein n=1 Tax=Formosa algae TaxID=225843 RepID=A0A9X0YKQ3_9FLAO|nr:TonB-dependent receptor [Formosa algae]MBP1840356.1 hemoglobin/transferrin/lactoferrin receptor protein [Formosa algae]MDQ0334220.1 hemoglobin/transferrin/lactoferrin receptor protein [Formosa algae]OEI82213.1 TonB-dependent receptor [Formosa algae]